MSKKIDVINDTYSQLRISGLTVQPSPESVQAAMVRLENMMAELEVRAICLGYNFEDIPDPNSETGVPHGFNQMMATNLAVRLIPDFNKEVPMALKGQAVQSMAVASSFSARNRLNQVSYPSRQPIGEANTLRNNWWRKYYPGNVTIKTDCNNAKMLVGEIEDYKENFHADLATESIQSFVTDNTNGLKVTNSAISNESIIYRVEAVSASRSANQTVTITITTDSGRVITHLIHYSLQSVEKVI